MAVKLSIGWIFDDNMSTMYQYVHQEKIPVHVSGFPYISDVDLLRFWLIIFLHF